jgi:integrase
MKDIIPIDNNGSIQLKFSIEGHRYTFNPIPRGRYSNRRDLQVASAIAIQIQDDILAGVFDASLSKYRHKAGVDLVPPKPHSLLEIWDLWVDSLDLEPQTRAAHHDLVKKMIENRIPAPNSTATVNNTSWFTGSKLAPRTYNQRLGYLKRCFDWALDQKLVTKNPWLTIKPRKTARPQIKPFNQQEIIQIINGFQDRFPHYVPFVKFLFLTGVRSGEAIGLCWHHVDFRRGEIAISESLSRDRTGNSHQLIRKSTKTGSVRILTISLDLKELLEELAGSRKSELVFTNKEGRVIRWRSFADNWKAVLEGSGIPYRKPHTVRHSMISRAIEQGIPLTGIAYLAGHSDTRMVMQTYGHMINRPDLPTLNLTQ